LVENTISRSFGLAGEFAAYRPHHARLGLSHGGALGARVRSHLFFFESLAVTIRRHGQRFEEVRFTVS
jgi:hypothetical protein